MSRDYYGIKYCTKVIKRLSRMKKIFYGDSGKGFRKHTIEYQQEIDFPIYLDKFTKEKELGKPPSYDPQIHGSDDARIETTKKNNC